MPIHFKIEDKIGFFTTIGDVEYEEGFQVLMDGLERLKSESVNRVLFDIRQSRESRSPQEIRSVAETVSKNVKNSKVAVVANRDL